MPIPEGARGGLIVCAGGALRSRGPRKPSSPLSAPITELIPGFSDIGAPLEDLGPVDPTLAGNPLDGELHWGSGATEADAFFHDFSSNFRGPHFARWARNVQVFERMGDFRDKCVHPGTNLTGPNPQLASEYVLIRIYRVLLSFLGRVCDPDMPKAGIDLWNVENPLEIDAKPGVYSVFLSAYIMNIGIYKLGLDKVHSDYGGVPMKLAPGSKLETGTTPIVDSTNLNRTIAELAVAFYLAPRVASSLHSLGLTEISATSA